MDSRALHARARTRGVNPIVYWLTRAVLQPFAHLFWRLSRIGREHIPVEGPVLLVCNHRSIIDPFIIGLLGRWESQSVASGGSRWKPARPSSRWR